jgi:hypothetical protein
MKIAPTIMIGMIAIKPLTMEEMDFKLENLASGPERRVVKSVTLSIRDFLPSFLPMEIQLLNCVVSVIGQLIFE